MHDNASQTTPSGTPRPIETAADARNAISELTTVMDGLEAVVSEETRLVRAGHLRKASGLGLREVRAFRPLLQGGGAAEGERQASFTPGAAGCRRARPAGTSCCRRS